VADGISRLFQAYGHAAVSVAEGGTVIDPEVVSALLRRRANVVRTSTLSESTRCCEALMAEGRTNAAIAHALFIQEAHSGQARQQHHDG
jgi:DNA-binding NarL/FixJ family response regulator